MGNLCCLCIDNNDNNDNNEYNEYKKKNINYDKVDNDTLKQILINTYIDETIWVSVTSEDYDKYKNNSDEVVNAMCLEDNKILELQKGDIIFITLNINLKPDLLLIIN